MASYVAEMEQTVSPRVIINPSGSYDQTSPIDANGNPVPVYSGVMYVMIGLDTDGNGFTNDPTAGRATGFLVAPNVLVTAAHIMVNENITTHNIFITNNAKPCHSGSPIYHTTSKKCYAVFTQGNATVN